LGINAPAKATININPEEIKIGLFLPYLSAIKPDIREPTKYPE